MKDVWLLLVLAAALGSGVISGVFFAFSTFVMQALARQPAPASIATMQAINVTVINPLFLGLFLGTTLLSGAILAAPLFAQGLPALGAGWAMAGALAHLAGTFGVTLLANVPRNHRLARLAADSDEAARYWPSYLRQWSRWNHCRTVAAILASLGFILALRVAQG